MFSYESGILENPDQEAPETLYQMTSAPETAPNDPTILEIDFDKGNVYSQLLANFRFSKLTLQHYVTQLFFPGNPVSLTNTQSGELITEQLALFVSLNDIAGRHGIGRIDIVENRFLGLKVSTPLHGYKTVGILSF